MIEYGIAAIAFAIMLHFRYVHEVLTIVRDLRVALDIEDEPNPFHPILFSVVFFIFSTAFMPIMFLYIFATERATVLKDLSGAIVKSYFQLQDK